MDHKINLPEKHILVLWLEVRTFIDYQKSAGMPPRYAMMTHESSSDNMVHFVILYKVPIQDRV